MKSIFILGASSDIGKALSYEYAKDGYSLILSARDSSVLNDLKIDLEVKYKVQVDLVNLNLESFREIESIISSYHEKLSGFVLMAGYLGEQNLAESDSLEAIKLMNINYTGSCLALEQAAKILKTTRNSFIIGVASVAGLRGRQSNYYYGSAKAGLISFLSGLRNKMCKHDCHVLTVLPGFVDTKMTAHLDLPKALTASATQVAKDIKKAQKKKKNVIYSLFVWRYIMYIIRMIPESIFKKMNL
ncbi:MAG: short-chain dehydrogenase [Candidatus Cloacimonadota bacterium]|nr:MAG: short-chain dehydrogenase [Candidatus Cloacimonadota bacterium]